MSSLEYFEPTINAYSSILLPRDDGSITVTATAPDPAGSVIVQGVALTAGGPGRITGGAPTFDATLATTTLIAASIMDALNDPANPFLALGVSAKSFGAVVGLRRTNPAVAIGGVITGVTYLQAVIGDLAAGALTRQIGTPPCHTETFASQVIRWIRAEQGARVYWNYTPAVPEGLIDPGFELDVTEDDALILFDELDAQGAFYLGAGNRFFNLPIGPTFPATLNNQQDVVDKLLAGTLTIRGTSGLTSAQMQTLARIPLVMTAIRAAYYLNYPMHVVWGATNLGVGPSGTGTGEPVFSDAPNEISNPNDRSVAFGAFNYRKWPYPIRNGLDTRIKTAMLEVSVAPVAANAEFVALTGEWLAKTLINVG